MPSPHTATAEALAAITDAGLFERLSTAILREAEPACKGLVHPGVNAKGQTIKSPVDAICFEMEANPPHMIAVHHTTAARSALEHKWLFEPQGSSQRSQGDLIKTAALVARERLRTANLRATLILTTNQEPDEVLVRSVVAKGREHDLEVIIWSRSRLCHFLDNNPTGQWIRNSYLNISQELLSPELLQELSRSSYEIQLPRLMDNPEAWISRSLDSELKFSLSRDVTFLMAGSGMGKSVACIRMLENHLKNGLFGMVISPETIASANTIDQVVATTLSQLHPQLSPIGPTAFSFCSTDRPMLLLVEDINRSGDAKRLAEKLTSWSRVATGKQTSAPSPWRLICPLWPEVIASMGEQGQERISSLIHVVKTFTDSEGRDAVIVRERFNGREISHLQANEISCALGKDPLLIALYDQKIEPYSHQVIGQFVERSLSRTAAGNMTPSTTELRQALRQLAEAMLSNRNLEPSWGELIQWLGSRSEALDSLRRLRHQGELIRLTGTSENEQLLFRHDRVRDWFLSDAASELVKLGNLSNELIAEPYFAGIWGTVLVWGPQDINFLESITTSNPLALFYALRIYGRDNSPYLKTILDTVTALLNCSAFHNQSNSNLRWEALALLSETDSPSVPMIVRKFPGYSTAGQLARLRNGDVAGGIELLQGIAPGVTAGWLDAHIEHAKSYYVNGISNALDNFLKIAELNSAVRIGTLRLAGYMGTPSLVSAIEECWNADASRNNHLADYLWAFGQCCEQDPARYLGPVCDAWAKLPSNAATGKWPSPRDDLAAHELRWAFRKNLPRAAVIEYFAQRGAQDDLNGPITFMLHSIDHPVAVQFVVCELAAIHQRYQEVGSFSPFVDLVRSEWQRAQEEYARPMSAASRMLLLELWQDESTDSHLCAQAFSLWAATQYPEDIEILRAAAPSDRLADDILRTRLSRGDQSAIFAMIIKLEADTGDFWWQFGCNLWSSDLSKALDEHLETRGNRVEHIWGAFFESDWITSELIMRLPEMEAEQILLKHWGHLKFSSFFVQAALYVATPRLVEMAQTAVNACTEPRQMMDHLGFRYGIRTKGRIGVTREAQLYALEPVLMHLSALDVLMLWETCNDHGWYALRRKLLDDRLTPPFTLRKWDPERAVIDLDKMVSEKLPIPIDHWIDEFVKTGVSWEEIRDTMRKWLLQRLTLEALTVFAFAIQCRGSRLDLGALEDLDGLPEDQAREVILDTIFAVQRRSLRS